MKQENWEEGFVQLSNEKGLVWEGWKWLSEREIGIIKSFIRQTRLDAVEEYRKELKERLPKKLKIIGSSTEDGDDESYGWGYNKALDDIINLIDEN